MNYEKEAQDLLNDAISKGRDEMIDKLIKLGEANIFIPVMVEVIRIARSQNKHQCIKLIEEYMNSAYSPGLRAHVLDDFIRDRIRIQAELNDLKTLHNIYVLEQKLFMYEQAESMLRTTATSGATYEIMKILEFRGDLRSSSE